jgi:hypothetical protein
VSFRCSHGRGHLRETFRGVARAQEAARVAIEVAPAAGEDPSVIEALADFALADMA